MNRQFGKCTPIVGEARFIASQKRRRSHLASFAMVGLSAVFSMGNLLPSTSLAATVQGRAFWDPNDNGVWDTCESARANTTIYIRDNNLANAGMGGFFTAMTDASARYSSIAHNAGPFTIWADIPSGKRQTSPVRGEGFVMYDFTIANTSQTVTIDFGISDPAPTTPPTITLPNATMAVNMDSPANFKANVDDTDGICAVHWDFGDDSTANTLNANHTYTVHPALILRH
jgi:hypothetical protein